MALTLRTLPHDERHGIDLPEQFRWGLWPAFLPVWVLDVYYGVCRSSLQDLTGERQMEAICNGVYPYSYPEAFHRRAISRLTRSGYAIPCDVEGSLKLLMELGLVVLNNDSYDVLLSPAYPEKTLHLSFWHRRQLATYRYYAVYRDVFTRLSHMLSGEFVEVDANDLKEILGVSPTTFRSIMKTAVNREFLSVKPRKSLRGRTVLQIRFTNAAPIPITEEERIVLRLLREKGDLVVTTLSQLSDEFGMPITSCRSTIHSLNVKERLFLDDPIEFADDNTEIFIDLMITSPE